MVIENDTSKLSTDASTPIPQCPIDEGEFHVFLSHNSQDKNAIRRFEPWFAHVGPIDGLTLSCYCQATWEAVYIARSTHFGQCAVRNWLSFACDDRS